MRILHIYKDYYPVLGGIENHVKLLGEGQAALGHQVCVLVTSLNRQSHEQTINGVRVVYAGRLATISSAPISLALPPLVNAEQADVVHLHFPNPWGELAEYLFGRARHRVLTYHSDIVRQRYMRMVYAPLLDRVLKRVDRIIATSPNYVVTSPVLAKWKSKCRVVPLGIDPSSFVGDGFSDSQTSSSAAGRPTLLFVGRLRYYKGLGYLLQALATIPEVRLVVVGTGPMEAEWKRFAHSLGVAGRVEFAGDVPDGALPAYYAGADVFVLPASERSEAFGAVQLEAMAAGIPVVSTDVGTGVAWVNQKDVTGIVVPPREPQALAVAIRRLIGDPELRKRMGQAGRARVLGEFTVGQMVSSVIQVYESIQNGIV